MEKGVQTKPRRMRGLKLGDFYEEICKEQNNNFIHIRLLGRARLLSPTNRVLRREIKHNLK